MSLLFLAVGTLVKLPTIDSANNGDLFTTATMQATGGDGDVLVSLIAFGRVGRELAALDAGDALSVTGYANLSHWQGKDGQERHELSLTAESVQSLSQMSQHKRQINDGEDSNH
jgi:single-stranded DNA-binding protein